MRKFLRKRLSIKNKRKTSCFYKNKDTNVYKFVFRENKLLNIIYAQYSFDIAKTNCCLLRMLNIIQLFYIMNV